MPNLAAIDVGSNAIRMMVGHPETGGQLTTLENLRVPVRLGQDAFTTGQFSEPAMRMALDAFVRFRQVAELFEVSRTRAVATSAMREAANSDLLIDRVARETGFVIEVISGEEEARLIHAAVKHAVDLAGKTALLVDVGGGSVEVVLSDGENVLSTESFGLGSVRLLSKLKTSSGKPMPLNSLLREYAGSAHRYIDREIKGSKVQLCLGTGGSIEEVGRLRKRLLEKRRSDLVTLGELNRLIETLGGMSVEQRVQQVGLNPDRADVILPAMIVLQMIAREARVAKVLIPGVGLKDGVLLEMLPLAAGPSLPRRVQALASAERMGQKYAYDGEHAAVTARLAVRLFNQTLSLHHLTENECLLLEVAAMLHDVGHYVNTVDHDRHGHYLLMHHPLIGLTRAEQEIVATLVYYHRRRPLAASDENLRAMTSKDRATLTKLCALLRVADALDTSHLSRVQDVILEQEAAGQWRLHLVSESEAMLEKWALEKRKLLFQAVFGVSLV